MKKVILPIIFLFLLSFCNTTASDKVVYVDYGNTKENDRFMGIGYQIIDTDSSNTLSPYAEFQFFNKLNSTEIDNFLSCFAGIKVPVISSLLPFSNVTNTMSFEIGAGVSLGNFFGSKKYQSIAGKFAVSYIFDNKFGFRVATNVLPDFEYSGDHSLFEISIFYKI